VIVYWILDYQNEEENTRRDVKYYRAVNGDGDRVLEKKKKKRAASILQYPLIIIHSYVRTPASHCLS
jgi:hypothetical protein